MKKQVGGFTTSSVVIILVSAILVFVIIGIIIKVYDNYKISNPDTITTDYCIDDIKAMNKTTLNCPDYWKLDSLTDTTATCKKINDLNTGSLNSSTITLPTLTSEKWGDILKDGISNKSFSNILDNDEIKKRCDIIDKGIVWQGFNDFC